MFLWVSNSAAKVRNNFDMAKKKRIKPKKYQGNTKARAGESNKRTPPRTRGGLPTITTNHRPSADTLGKQKREHTEPLASGASRHAHRATWGAQARGRANARPRAGAVPERGGAAARAASQPKRGSYPLIIRRGRSPPTGQRA